jgi:hypothetical protein
MNLSVVPYIMSFTGQTVSLVYEFLDTDWFRERTKTLGLLCHWISVNDRDYDPNISLALVRMLHCNAPFPPTSISSSQLCPCPRRQPTVIPWTYISVFWYTWVRTRASPGFSCSCSRLPLRGELRNNFPMKILILLMIANRTYRDNKLWLWEPRKR